MKNAKSGLNTQLWNSNYNDLCAYLSEHKCGVGDIPDDAVTRNGKSLKRWVYEMNKACRGKSRYELTEEQIGLLREIGIAEMLSATEAAWYEHFNDLLRFYSENHHLNIPRSELCSDGTMLLQWTRQQRNKYQKHTLSERYADEFRRHGLIKVLENPLDTAMRHIEEYYKEHGDIDFETSYVCPDGYKLGVWLRTFRDRYINQKNKKPFPQEVIDRLNEMGIIWNKTEDHWDKCYQACKTYLEIHKGYTLPANLTAEDGSSVKSWLTNNRKLYRQGKLTEKRAELLEAIHILEITFFTPVYDPEDSEIFKTADGQLWLANYRKCRDHLLENGGNYLPMDMLTVNGKPMNKWLYVNRMRYNDGSLPKEKQELLEMIKIESIRFKNTELLKKHKRANSGTRTKTLHIRMTESEHAKIRTMTKRAGYANISDYVRDKLLKENE